MVCILITGRCCVKQWTLLAIWPPSHSWEPALAWSTSLSVWNGLERQSRKQELGWSICYDRIVRPVYQCSLKIANMCIAHAAAIPTPQIRKMSFYIPSNEFWQTALVRWTLFRNECQYPICMQLLLPSWKDRNCYCTVQVSTPEFQMQSLRESPSAC